MNVRSASTIILVLPLLAFASQSAMADRVALQGRDKVQGKCGTSGGTYWSEGKTGHTYGCMNPDGSGIVCGGVTKDQKNSCDTFRQAPNPHPFPTREEAWKGEMKAKGEMK